MSMATTDKIGRRWDASGCYVECAQCDTKWRPTSHAQITSLRLGITSIITWLVTSILQYGNPLSAYSGTRSVWVLSFSRMRLANHPGNTWGTNTSDYRHDCGSFIVTMSMEYCKYRNSSQVLVIWFVCRNTPPNTTTFLDTSNISP